MNSSSSITEETENGNSENWSKGALAVHFTKNGRTEFAFTIGSFQKRVIYTFSREILTCETITSNIGKHLCSVLVENLSGIIIILQENLWKTIDLHGAFEIAERSMPLPLVSNQMPLKGTEIYDALATGKAISNSSKQTSEDEQETSTCIKTNVDKKEFQEKALNKSVQDCYCLEHRRNNIQSEVEAASIAAVDKIKEARTKLSCTNNEQTTTKKSTGKSHHDNSAKENENSRETGIGHQTFKMDHRFVTHQDILETNSVETFDAFDCINEDVDNSNLFKGDFKTFDSEIQNDNVKDSERYQNILLKVLETMSEMKETMLNLKAEVLKLSKHLELKEKMPMATKSDDTLDHQMDCGNISTRLPRNEYTTSHGKSPHQTRNQEIDDRCEENTSLKTVHNNFKVGRKTDLSTGSRRRCTIIDPSIPSKERLFSSETIFGDDEEPEQTLDCLKLPDPTPCLRNETDAKSLIILQEKCFKTLAGNSDNNFRIPEQTISSGYPMRSASSKEMTSARSSLFEKVSFENSDYGRNHNLPLSVTDPDSVVNEVDDASNAKTSIENPSEGQNRSMEIQELEDRVFSDNDVKQKPLVSENINVHLKESSENFENENLSYVSNNQDISKNHLNDSKEHQDIPRMDYQTSISPSSSDQAVTFFGSKYAGRNSTLPSFVRGMQLDDIKQDMNDKISTLSKIENGLPFYLRCITFGSNRKRKIVFCNGISNLMYVDLKRYKPSTEAWKPDENSSNEKMPLCTKPAVEHKEKTGICQLTMLEKETLNFAQIQCKNENVLGCLFEQSDSKFKNIQFLMVGVDGILRQIDSLKVDCVVRKERKRPLSETVCELKDKSVNSKIVRRDVSDGKNVPVFSKIDNEVLNIDFSKSSRPLNITDNVKDMTPEIDLNQIPSCWSPEERNVIKKKETEMRKFINERLFPAPEICSMSGGQLSVNTSTDNSTSAEKTSFRKRKSKQTGQSTECYTSLEQGTLRRKIKKHLEISAENSTAAERTIDVKRRNRKLSVSTDKSTKRSESTGRSTSVSTATLRKRDKKSSVSTDSSSAVSRATLRRMNIKCSVSADRSVAVSSATLSRRNRKPSASTDSSFSFSRATLSRRNKKPSASKDSYTTPASPNFRKWCSDNLKQHTFFSPSHSNKKMSFMAEASSAIFDSGIGFSMPSLENDESQILYELSHKVAFSGIPDQDHETAPRKVSIFIELTRKQSKLEVRVDSSQLKDLHNKYEKHMNQYFKDKGSLTLEDFVKELQINHSTVQVFGLTEYFNRLTRGEFLSDQQRMQYEWLRLASFQHYTGNGNALSLARNGFYHNPTDGPTSTRCYLCEARHSTWEYFDNIEVEHRRQSPDCPFHSNRSEESTNVSISYETPSQSHRAQAASTPVHSTVSSPGTASTSLASLSQTQTQTTSKNIYQPQENDENSQHSLLALPNSRSFRALGRSGETAYSDLTIPPRRNNVVSGASSTNASLDGFASSVPTSTAANTVSSSVPTSIATSTSSVSIQQSSISSRPIAAGAFGGFNAPTSTSISTSSSTTSTSMSQSVSAPAVAAASSLQRPSQTPIGGGGLKAAVSSHLRPSQTPIGGGGRTDPTITVVVENAKHPDYRELDTRINSYQGWPDYLDQTARQMAEAGFFFVGVADFTRCFCCGGGLRNWEPGDDPMLEHTRWFPRCEYVNKLKGERYVAAVQRRHQQHMEEQQRQQQELARSRDANRNPPDPMSTEAAAVLREMGYQQERIKDAILTVRRQIGVPDVTTQQVLAWLLDQHEARSSPTSSRSSPTRDLGVKVNASLPSSTIQTSTQSSVINSTPSVSTTTSAALNGSSSSVVSSTSTATGAGSQKSSSSTSTTSSSSSTEAGGKPTSQTGFKENGAKEGKSIVNQSAASGGKSDEEFKSAEETLSTDTKPAKKKTRKKNKAKSGAKTSDAQSKLNVVDTQALKEENEKLREMQTCKICMERLVNTTLLPCGHLVCCDVCAARLNRCPICRKRIKGTVKTFMS